MQLAALLFSGFFAAAPAPTQKAPAPPPPPQAVVLSPLAGAPLVGSPSFTLDNAKVLVSRFGPPRGQPSLAGHAGKIYLVPLDHPDEAEAIDVVGSNDHGAFNARLSPDGKYISYLADGELWVVAAPGSDASPKEPERLYPPKEGAAPLGPKLSLATWAFGRTWLLIQSPLAWARVSVETGEIAVLPLKPSDLSGGSLVLGPDAQHAAFVRPSSGPGWVNGAKVVVLNIETGQAQIADFEHDYTEVAALPDGQLLGKDANGNLWVLRGGSRMLYFQPPTVAGASAGQYALSLDGSRIAYVSTNSAGTRSQLFVGEAPRPPPWAKHGESPADKARGPAH
jgi:hypothetical protein